MQRPAVILMTSPAVAGKSGNGLCFRLSAHSYIAAGIAGSALRLGQHGLARRSAGADKSVSSS